MKKITPLLGPALVLALISCSLFRGKPVAYPRGLMFPLEEAASLDYGGRMVGAPVRESDRLYLATDRGLICAIDLAARKTSWEFVALDPLVCAPVLDGDNLAAAGTGGRVYCLDKATGGLRWQKDVPGLAVAWMVSSEGRLVLAGREGPVLALAFQDGAELWRRGLDSPLAAGPVLWTWGRPHVLLFTADRRLECLSLEGRTAFALELKKTPSSEPLLDRNLVFYGGLDRSIQCFDLSARKTRWTVRLAGVTTSPLRIQGSELYLWTSSGALYCLDKSNGNVDWWKSVASRLSFPPAVVGDKIVLSVASPSLVSFDVRTGKETGSFSTGLELLGPALWFEPYLLVNGFDPAANTARLLFLKKQVKVVIKASKQSPQGLSEEINFTAQAAGFFRPQYEFSLTGPSGTEVVQKMSEEDTWSWYPDKEGEYTVKVLVTDEREKAEGEMSYTISAEAAAPVKKAPEAKPPAGKPPVKKKTPRIKKKGGRI
jgi:outer membrane protein assembly factor BamB